MPTSTSSSLFRFLLSLVVRLRGRITLAFRAWFTSFWRSFLTFSRCRERSQIRLHANDAPVVDNNPTEERLQISECAKVEEEDSRSLAVPPVHRITTWEDKLSKYQAPTRLEFTAQPATPQQASQRYEPRRVRGHAEPPEIPAGRQKLLSAPPPPPDGWRRHVHPEGNVYFYHEELRIFTESNIFERGTEILSRATTLIQQAIQIGKDTDDVVIMDDLTETVLNVDNNGWHYYFVDHGNRLLFWVHPVELRKVLDTQVEGIREYSHIRYLVEEKYWYASLGSPSGTYTVYDMKSRSHCEYYPHNRTLPKGVFEGLRGMLNLAKTDMITTPSSPSPFGQDELVAILDIVNSMKDDKKISDSYSIWIIARLMVYFTENQFVNFCGQPCARLNADTPLYEQRAWNRSRVFKVVNFFLFGSLNDHAVRLKRVWVDGVIIHPRWKDFINRLTLEWSRYTIFSTVMLTVNFSFLAIPGVVTPGSPTGEIQIIIYCSVVSTIGSIVFSFVLLNVYGNPERLAVDPAAKAMWTIGQRTWGMLCLAITHSLPIACLMWSIALFSMALAVQIFGPKEPAVFTTLGVECLVLVLFGYMSSYVMGLFCSDDQSDVVDVGVLDVSDEKISSLPASQHDVEEGLAA